MTGSLNRDKLDDLAIDFAQLLLKKQFYGISGLQSTLLQSKSAKQQSQLQILHAGKDHWID